MVEILIPGPLGNSSLDGPCGFSASLGSTAFDRLSQKVGLAEASRAQTGEWATAKAEIGLEPIGIYRLKAESACYRDRASGEIREELTLTSPDFGDEAIGTWTDAGENGTGTKEEYQRITSLARQLAETEGEAAVFWVSPGKENPKSTAVPQHRAYVWNKDGEGNVTAYAYQLTGSLASLGRMMENLGEENTTRPLTERTVFRQGPVSSFNHGEVFHSFVSSLTEGEKERHQTFLERFKQEIATPDAVRWQRLEQDKKDYQTKLKEVYHEDIQAALRAVVTGFIKIAEDLRETKNWGRSESFLPPKIEASRWIRREGEVRQKIDLQKEAEGISASPPAKKTQQVRQGSKKKQEKAKWRDLVFRFAPVFLAFVNFLPEAKKTEPKESGKKEQEKKERRKETKMLKRERGQGLLFIPALASFRKRAREVIFAPPKSPGAVEHFSKKQKEKKAVLTGVKVSPETVFPNKELPVFEAKPVVVLPKIFLGFTERPSLLPEVFQKTVWRAALKEILGKISKDAEKGKRETRVRKWERKAVKLGETILSLPVPFREVKEKEGKKKKGLEAFKSRLILWLSLYREQNISAKVRRVLGKLIYLEIKRFRNKERQKQVVLPKELARRINSFLRYAFPLEAGIKRLVYQLKTMREAIGQRKNSGISGAEEPSPAVFSFIYELICREFPLQFKRRKFFYQDPQTTKRKKIFPRFGVIYRYSPTLMN